MKKVSCILVSLAIVVLAITLVGPQASAQTVTLKMNSPFAEKRQISKYLNEFAQRISKNSKGSLEIKLFHGGSLGVKDADILRLLSDGFVDASIVWGGYLHRDAPELFNSYSAGAVSTPKEHEKAVPAILDTYQKTSAKWDIPFVGFIQGPLYDTCLYCKKPVGNLKQLKGKKVRVWSKQQVETLKKLDVAGQIIPQADMYMSLQTGVVDCAIYLSAIAPLMHLQEVAPHESYILPFASMPVALGFSKKALARLSDEQKAIVNEAADYIGQKSYQESMANALDVAKRKAATQARVEKGFTVLPDFPEQDRKEFVEKAVEVWEELAGEAGPAAVESRKKTLDAIAK